MVHSPNLASPQRLHTGTKYGHVLEHVAGRDLSVPTLYRRKEHGGLALIHAEAKCRALLLCRLQTLSQNSRTTTAQLLKKWNLLQPRKNPPNREIIPATLDYLRTLETDCAYIVPQGKTETVQTYRRRIYDTIIILMNTETKPPSMRIERPRPNIEWPRIWKNLLTAPVTDSTKTA